MRIVPSTNTITIYNANSVAMDMAGLELYKGTGATRCGSAFSGELDGQTVSTQSCAISA